MIKLENVSFRHNRQELLKDISLEISKNDFVGLVGPNGGGKTTLIKLILGLIEPDEGTIRINGMPPIKGRKSIGYLPQHENVDFDYPVTVEEVVLMSRIRPLKRYRKKDYRIIRESLEKVKMWRLKDRMLNELSGGEKQRVFVARALAAEPEYLVLDEPMANVDIKSQKDFYRLLKKLSKNIGILVVDHNLKMLSEYVNKVACVNKCSYHSLKKHNLHKIRQMI